MKTDRRFRRQVDEAERERFEYYAMQREHLFFLYKLVCRPTKTRRSVELRRYSAAGRELQRQVISAPVVEMTA